MSDDPKTLVSTDWLETHLNDPDLRILDASWYLPAMNELNAMYQELGPANNGFDGSGEMEGLEYWSSTDLDLFHAFHQRFLDGEQDYDNKLIHFSCRCVRR